jgi:hypothetical protein
MESFWRYPPEVLDRFFPQFVRTSFQIPQSGKWVCNFHRLVAVWSLVIELSRNQMDYDLSHVQMEHDLKILAHILPNCRSPSEQVRVS